MINNYKNILNINLNYLNLNKLKKLVYLLICLFYHNYFRENDFI